MALRWGIAGCGKISNDFVNSLSVLPSTKHKVEAVAARSLQSAEKFAKTFSVEKFYEGYLNLALDADVDVVYVGVLNPQHFEVSKLMLEHGKHVLCEKPFTMNEKQTQELVNLARQKKLFLMEAVWSRCFPVYRKLREIIDSGAIGDVKFVSATFGYDLADIERVKSKELGGGGILDLGVYVLQLQQFAFRGLKPDKILAAGVLNEFGTDDTSNSIITYPGGGIAMVATSTTVELPNEAVIVGTKGIVRVPPYFWCPTELILNKETLTFELPSGSKGEFFFLNSIGLSYEAEEVYDCIKAGKLESSQITHQESIALAGYMDEIRRQVGVVFPEDG